METETTRRIDFTNLAGYARRVPGASPNNAGSRTYS
jgi:hypothetical protein